MVNGCSIPGEKKTASLEFDHVWLPKVTAWLCLAANFREFNQQRTASDASVRESSLNSEKRDPPN